MVFYPDVGEQRIAFSKFEKNEGTVFHYFCPEFCENLRNRSSTISIESEDPYEQYNYSREELKLKFNNFYRKQIRRLKNKYTLA